MKSLAARGAADQAVLFLVCERGRRWTEAAKRFIGPFRHSRRAVESERCSIDPSPLFLVQPLAAEKVRDLISGQSSVAILWELSHDNVTENSLRIAQIAASRADVLQLIAVDDLTPFETKTLALRIMELGVAGVLHSPADLAMYARMVCKRFSP